MTQATRRTLLHEIFYLPPARKTSLSENQVRGVISQLPQTWANGLRDYGMSAEVKKKRKELVQAFDMLQTAAVISSLFMIVAFLAFPNFFTACSMVMICYTTYEVCSVISNVKRIFDDFTLEARCSNSEQALLEEVCRGTFLARHVIPLITVEE